jgi:hypothetical protein
MPPVVFLITGRLFADVVRLATFSADGERLFACAGKRYVLGAQASSPATQPTLILVSVI